MTFLALSFQDASMVNMSSSGSSSSQQASPRSHSQIQSTTPLARSTIDDFREIIREQSFIIPNQSPADGDRFDVPVKKYPPLPDIAVPSHQTHLTPFFRTETVFNSNKSNPPKKQMFYHFARSQRGHLPSLAKPALPPSISNVMDLDENLPECYNRIPNRTETYTSPNDRISSPIKRPSAPSPPASAQIKRAGQNLFVHSQVEEDDDDYRVDDDEDDSRFDEVESQLFENHFSRYSQSTTLHQRYRRSNDRTQTLAIDDEPTITSFSRHGFDE